MTEKVIDNMSDQKRSSVVDDKVSNVDVTSDFDYDTTKCGNCGNKFNIIKDKDINYRRECLICHVVHPIRATCAKKIFLHQVLNQHTQNPLKSTKKEQDNRFSEINAEQFSSMNAIEFYCKSCKQDQCFVCATSHRSGFIKPLVCSICKKKWSFVMQDTSKKNGCIMKCLNRNEIANTVCNKCKHAMCEPEYKTRFATNSPEKAVKGVSTQKNNSEVVLKKKDDTKESTGIEVDERQVSNTNNDESEITSTKKADMNETTAIEVDEREVSDTNNNESQVRSTKKADTNETTAMKVDERELTNTNNDESEVTLTKKSDTNENTVKKIDKREVSDTKGPNEEDEVEVQYDNILRYSYNKISRNQSDLVFNIDSIPTKRNLVDLFESTFGINGRGYSNNFETMQSAKQQMLKKFSFLTDYSSSEFDKDSRNLFNYHIKEYVRKEYNIDHNPNKDKHGIYIYMKGIESLYDQNWLNDEVIEFVMQFLNFYLESNKETTSSISSTLIGSTFSEPMVIPDKNRLPVIKKYVRYLKRNNMNCSEFNNFNKLSRELIQWYSEEKKGPLTRQLDTLQTYSIPMTKYLSVLNVDNNHWVHLDVTLDNDAMNKNFGGTVKIVDSIVGSSNIALKSCVWIAKFFGMYQKKHHKKDFNKSDFDGKDIADALNGMNNVSDKDILTLNEDKSCLGISCRGSKFQQEDGYNCGIIALLELVDAATRTTNIDTLLKCDDKAKELTQWRLRILTLVDQAHEFIYGKEYDQCKGHIYLNETTGNYEKDKKKFKLIHKLFENNTMQLLVSDDESGCINANSIFRDLPIEVLEDMVNDTDLKEFSDVDAIATIEEMNKKQAVKSPKKSSSTATKRSPEKMKSQSAKKRKNESNKKNPGKKKKKNLSAANKKSGFNKAIADLPTLSLTESGHDRTSNFICVSNFNLLIETFLSPTFGLKAAPDMIKNIKLKPTDVVDNIIELFANNYLGVDKDNRNPKKVKEMNSHIRRLMESWDTYFIMDHPKTGRKNNKYHIVAVMIIENATKSNGGGAAIIHAAALYQDVLGYKDYFNKMFHYIMNEDESNKKRTYYAISNVCGNIFKTEKDTDTSPMEELKKLHFSRSEDTYLIQSLIPSQSFVLSTEAYNLHNQRAPYTNDTERRLLINNRVKTRFMFDNKKEKFLCESNSFGWTEATDDELDFFSKYKTAVRKFPKKPFTFSGAGSRSKNSQEIDTKFLTDIMIDEKFRQGYNYTNSNCVWLGVAIMLQFHDGYTGNIMLKEMHKSPTKFEWLPISRASRDEDRIEKVLNMEDIYLTDMLKLYTDYNLYKIDRTKNNIDGCFKDYLLNDETKGLYVCLLRDNNGTELHTVGVDCTKKHIYDCENENVVKLSHNGLEYCIGSDGRGLDCIRVCFEINKKPRRK